MPRSQLQSPSGRALGPSGAGGWGCPAGQQPPLCHPLLLAREGSGRQRPPSVSLLPTTQNPQEVPHFVEQGLHVPVRNCLAQSFPCLQNGGTDCSCFGGIGLSRSAEWMGGRCQLWPGLVPCEQGLRWCWSPPVQPSFGAAPSSSSSLPRDWGPCSVRLHTTHAPSLLRPLPEGAWSAGHGLSRPPR